MELNQQLSFKILLVGATGSGKTNMINRYVYDNFDPTSSPQGCDIADKTILIKYNACKFKIWDTAGITRTSDIPSITFRNTSGVLIVYDVTRQSTLYEIDDWMDILAEQNITVAHIPIMLVGNKIDMERTIGEDEARLMATKHNIHYSETSAKTKEGLNDTFKRLAILISEQEPTTTKEGECDPVGPEEQPTIKLNEARQTANTSDSCCWYTPYYGYHNPTCVCCFDCDDHHQTNDHLNLDSSNNDECCECGDGACDCGDCDCGDCTIM